MMFLLKEIEKLNLFQGVSAEKLSALVERSRQRTH